MWANMALLFFLSLIPVAVEWARIGLHEESPAAFFGIVSVAAALSYSVLVRSIVAVNGHDSLVARSVHGDRKGTASLALYLLGVAAAIVSSAGWISWALYVVVAIIWLVPDRRFLHDHPDEISPRP
jgi:TMEM175 potassium channel family protein